MPARYPQRIVCLTEETTETLYLMGEQDRIVGISGFTVRPPRARKEKPKVSAFISAKIGKILDLRPDLVLGFSDMQADIAAELVRAGVEVYVFNQRTVQGIFDMMLRLGSLIGTEHKALELIAGFESRMSEVVALSTGRRIPKVYFEEWDEPRISAIGWVSELIGIAGGEDCFPERAREQGAKGRIIEDDALIINAAPDIIIGSWCGKKFRPERVCARPGWEAIPAVCDGEVHEIKSPEILQPGPAALSDGLTSLHSIINQWRDKHES